MKRLIFIALLLSASVARAQSIGLPHLDSVNFYGELGDFESRDAKNLQPVGIYGWGFEAGFTVAASDTHILELSVGYDSFFEHAQFHDGTVLTGELRDLPSISLYATFSNDVYIGLATGVVSLANASIAGRATQYTVSGSTFDAAAKIGYSIPFQSSKPIDKQRLYGFVEIDYHVRYFGGLNYGVTSPTDLPNRIYLGGVTVALGIQISLDGKNSAKAKLKGDAPGKPNDPAPAKPAEAKN